MRNGDFQSVIPQENCTATIVDHLSSCRSFKAIYLFVL